MKAKSLLCYTGYPHILTTGCECSLALEMAKIRSGLMRLGFPKFLFETPHHLVGTAKKQLICCMLPALCKTDTALIWAFE